MDNFNQTSENKEPDTRTGEKYELKFRTLRANEIDCRIARINRNGLQLLLYKDARCDMNILDETVGPMNWQRTHSRDNANCTVSIWDVEKAAWISKEDTGTESNTEKEKGLASDSFKRACFNWGIGRELYTAPFIWITATDAKIESDNTRCKCNDRFSVSGIEYDQCRQISWLEITNDTKRKVVYVNGARKAGAEVIDKAKADALREKLEYAGRSITKCESFYGKSLSEFTPEEYLVLEKKLDIEIQKRKEQNEKEVRS